MNEELIRAKVIEAIKLKHDLIEDMKACGIKSNFPEKIEFNTYNGQIAEDGELVIEYYYGAPAKIFTPIGYIRVDGSYHTNDKPNAYKTFDELLVSKYGFKLARAEEMHSIGLIGPFYSKDGTMKWAEEAIDPDKCHDIFKSIIEEEEQK